MRLATTFYLLIVSLAIFDGSCARGDEDFEKSLRRFDAIRAALAKDQQPGKLQSLLETAENLPEERTSADWPRDRSRKLIALLTLAAAAHGCMDPSFDPADFPKRGVVPPRTTALPAGVAAEEIKDPDLRRQYVEAKTQSAKNVARYSRETDFRRLYDSALDAVREFARRAYTPSEAGEVRALLHEHLNNKEIEKNLEEIRP